MTDNLVRVSILICLGDMVIRHRFSYIGIILLSIWAYFSIIGMGVLGVVILIFTILALIDKKNPPSKRNFNSKAVLVTVVLVFILIIFYFLYLVLNQVTIQSSPPFPF